MLKKNTELPFLITLGVLLVLSAGFLGVHIFGDNKRGAASALEAPIIPPSLSAPEVVVAPPEIVSSKLEKATKPIELKQEPEETEQVSGLKPSKDLNQPEKAKETVGAEQASKNEKVKLTTPGKVTQSAQEKSSDDDITDSDPLKPVIEAGKDESGKDEEPAEKSEVETVKDKASGDFEEQVEAKHPEKSEKLIEPNVSDADEKRDSVILNNAPNALKSQKPEIAKPSLKSKFEEKTARPKEDIKQTPKKVIGDTRNNIPTEIPPEWNWFNKPLRMSLDDGRVELKASEGESLINLSEDADCLLKDAVAVEPVVNDDSFIEPASPDDSKNTLVVSSEKPFSEALERMARIKAGRKSLRPLKKAADKEIKSPSLRRLNDFLKSIRVRSSSVNFYRNSQNQSSVHVVKSNKVNSSRHLSTETVDQQSDKTTSGSSAAQYEEVSPISMQMRHFVRSGALHNP
jgi:hypothetical protein